MPATRAGGGQLGATGRSASDPQIASRFEQLELPIWTESRELRRFIAGYLALFPLKKVRH